MFTSHIKGKKEVVWVRWEVLDSEIHSNSAFAGCDSKADDKAT